MGLVVKSKKSLVTNCGVIFYISRLRLVQRYKLATNMAWGFAAKVTIGVWNTTLCCDETARLSFGFGDENLECLTHIL